MPLALLSAAGAQVVEESVQQRMQWWYAGSWVIPHQQAGQIRSLLGSRAFEDPVPAMRRDLWREGVLRVVGIHGLQLCRRRSAQHLDDLHQLVDAVSPSEKRLAQDHLAKHATCRPKIDGGRVADRSHNALGSSVEARAHVRPAALPKNQPSGRPKVAELQCMAFPVQQQVLRLDVRMHDAPAVEERQDPHQLVLIELDVIDVHRFLHHIVMLDHTMQRV
mmetsp:Transcript_106597/g.270709  ORF Transcript_106597/g.270709 Transcript_106597/m.270709 type:complete len:220 (+) Transcript_106597:171-830(+)